MPTYGYRCTVCAHEFERVQKMTDAPLTECESCGGAVKKVIYPVGIAFKGTGFYVTDYKGGGEKKSESGEKPAASDTATKSESGVKSDSGGESAKSETKAEVKSETKTEATKPANP